MHSVVRELIAHDPYDSYGSSMGALFDIAETLYVSFNGVPASWNYRVPMSVTAGTLSESATNLLEGLELGEYTTSDLVHAGEILRRHVDILTVQGKDY